MDMANMDSGRPDVAAVEAGMVDSDDLVDDRFGI
jgi:hypothetical protein